MAIQPAPKAEGAKIRNFHFELGGERAWVKRFPEISDGIVGGKNTGS